jgi:hypothetical protein
MEPFKKRKIILDQDKVNESLKSVLQKTLTKQKKPVKFTWKGAADLLMSMSNTPLREYNLSTLINTDLPRITDLVEGRDKPKEKDYIDFFEDMEKSIFGAAQNIAYSFGDLVTTGIDMGAPLVGKETNLTEALDKVYEETKIDDPETLLGTINKVLIEYGLPGGAVFKVMSRAKKLIKANNSCRHIRN